MEICFRSRMLQKTCSKKAEAVKRWGPKMAGKVMQRMMELQASETLADLSRLPPGRCHELTGARKGVFSVDLDHPYRLLFVPDHDPVPTLEDGGIDRRAVKRIEVIEITDTHKG